MLFMPTAESFNFMLYKIDSWRFKADTTYSGWTFLEKKKTYRHRVQFKKHFGTSIRALSLISGFLILWLLIIKQCLPEFAPN